jgi:hypothetical protein
MLPQSSSKSGKGYTPGRTHETPKFYDALDFRKVTWLTSTRYPQYFLIIAVDYNAVNA